MTQVSSCLKAANKTPINFLHLEVKWSKDRLGGKQRECHFFTDSSGVSVDGVGSLAEPLKWTTQAGAGVRARRTDSLCRRPPFTVSLVLEGVAHRSLLLGLYRHCTNV